MNTTNPAEIRRLAALDRAIQVVSGAEVPGSDRRADLILKVAGKFEDFMANGPKGGPQ